MDFRVALGFLGLLGIAILILIYLLKPNYQQKVISSTHVWKLSLKYKKKRLPINRLRNIIVIICQILIITLGSFILAQPIIAGAREEHRDDKIAIIDASVSMLAYQNNGHTRFENAVSKVRALGAETIANQCRISVIVAGEKATLEIQADYVKDLNAALDKLVDPNYMACGFGDADIEGAMTYAESVLADNPEAEVMFYTATEYHNNFGVEVVNIAESEWNVAIFNARMAFQLNYYTFYVDVANYNGMEMDDLAIHCIVTGVNGGQETRTETAYARCRGNNPDTVVFDTMKVYSFERIEFFVDEADSFSHDNHVTLFGGTKEKIRIMYCSSAKNVFFSSILKDYVEVFTDYEVILTENLFVEEPEFVGYDFYIFEHDTPDVLPKDGLVLLANPKTAPSGSGFNLSGVVNAPANSPFVLKNGDPHPITYLTDIGAGDERYDVQISRYSSISSYESYTPLMYCNGEPVFLVKNQVDSKIAVMTFSLNMSDAPVSLKFPIVMHNLFEYFFPRPVSQYLYDVNQKITISNAIGEYISVQSAEMDKTYEKALNEIPFSFTPTLPGEIALSQMFFDREFNDHIYVKISALQSNFSRTADIISPFVPAEKPLIDLDLLIYFAIAMIALAFVERWLQSRDQI